MSWVDDPQHCGGCELACSAGQSCDNGRCVGEATGAGGGASTVSTAAGSVSTGGALSSGTASTTTGGGVPSVDLSQLVGWATVNALGQDGTYGGGTAPVVEVSTLEDFQAAVSGTEPSVVSVSGSLSGTVEVGSNKTVIGAPGFELVGMVHLIGSVNVILHNLRLVGLNCSDSICGEDNYADTLLLREGTHHVWVDHLDISDGSDGNFDIIEASDYVTVSWTRFSYSSGNREHRFSNLVGNADTLTSDAGHLKVTFHHNWWAENVVERMPRVRFGEVHVFNNLYTSRGNNYCVGVGFDANILTENNVFIDVNNPIESTGYSNANSIVVSRGNEYDGASGQTGDRGSNVFEPPYPYELDAAGDVEAVVRDAAGVL